MVCVCVLFANAVSINDATWWLNFAYNTASFCHGYHSFCSWTVAMRVDEGRKIVNSKSLFSLSLAEYGRAEKRAPCVC